MKRIFGFICCSVMIACFFGFSLLNSQAAAVPAAPTAAVVQAGGDGPSLNTGSGKVLAAEEASLSAEAGASTTGSSRSASLVLGAGLVLAGFTGLYLLEKI